MQCQHVLALHRQAVLHPRQKAFFDSGQKEDVSVCPSNLILW